MHLVAMVTCYRVKCTYTCMYLLLTYIHCVLLLLLSPYMQLYDQITPLELLAILIAALCHDLDHPGNTIFNVIPITILSHIQYTVEPLYKDTLN